MKRIISVICMMLIVFCLSACGKKTANRTAGNNTKTVADVLNGSDNSKSNTSAGSTPQSGSISTEKCDIDLTVMNSTMVYAEVNNMMSNPNDYIGKTVKMKGSFSVYPGETRNYYACIIADATACCSQGIEFLLSDSRKYPDEYPAPGTEITVTGRFETYLEGTDLYCQLSDAIMS